MVNQIDIFYIRKYRHIEGGYQDALYSKNNGGKFSNIYKTWIIDFNLIDPLK